jgi:hypothetical protein
MTSKNVAVGTARKRARRQTSGVRVLSTGVRARLVPVSISIINEAQAAIADPLVPMWHNESKGTDEPNPNHPDYLKALEVVDQERNLAAIDAMILFGVELEDGVPNEEENNWLRKLRMSARLKLVQIDFDAWDLSDELELEFLYKKYIAVSAADLPDVMKASGVSEEDISQAAESFRNNQERGADRTTPAD